MSRPRFLFGFNNEVTTQSAEFQKKLSNTAGKESEITLRVGKANLKSVPGHYEIVVSEMDSNIGKLRENFGKKAVLVGICRLPGANLEEIHDLISEQKLDFGLSFEEIDNLVVKIISANQANMPIETPEQILRLLVEKAKERQLQ